MMSEIMPIGAGAVLGCVFVSAHLPWALPKAVAWGVRMAVVVAIGILVTVWSGEFRVNWGYAIVDIGEVGVACWVTACVLPWQPNLRPTYGDVSDG